MNRNISNEELRSIQLDMLQRHNILVSACNAKHGIEPDRYVRFAIRDVKDNDSLIEGLQIIGNIK